MWLMIYSWQKLLKPRLNESENNWNVTYFWITSVSEGDVRFIIKADVPDEVCTVKTLKTFHRSHWNIWQIFTIDWAFFSPPLSPLIRIFILLFWLHSEGGAVGWVRFYTYLCVFRPRCRGICAWKHLLRLQKWPPHLKDGSILPVNRHLLI